MNFTKELRLNIAVSPLPWFFFGLTLLLHILWPLSSGAFQSTLTTLAVLTLALASGFSAIQVLGIRTTFYMFGLVSLLAYAVERVGSSTGIPFGEYSYTDNLQPQVLSVPLAVVLAWFAMTWVMCVVIHDLPISLPIKAIVSGLLLTSWDFYLDPQMTRVEYWVWHTTTPSLPGISGIPLTNYLGWFFAGTMMSFIILRFIREQRVNSFLPKVVLLWTIVGGFILHAVFWRNITVGLWGAAAMGTIWIVVEKTTRRT